MKKITLQIIIACYLLSSTFAFALTDKNIYINDLKNRFANHTFTETADGTSVAVKFFNGSAVMVEQATAQSTGVINNAYREIRKKVLSGEKPPFRLTTLQRDALTSADISTIINNITTGQLEFYNGTVWSPALKESNEIGITASTTQTQAGGTALTVSMNFVETVANKDDAVTLLSVSNGSEQSIINDGINTLQIFPALGDDLGNGVNASMELEVHEEVTFWGKDSTTWHIRYMTENFHASMYEQNNSNVFTIHAANQAHAYHSANIVAGDLAGWIWNAGSAGASVTITAIADNSGGTILVTSGTAHGITVDDIVAQTGLSDSNYVGFFKALTVPTTTTYTVTATWGATGTGFVDRPAYLEAKGIAEGFYNLEWTSTMNVAGSGITLAFDLHDGTSVVAGSQSSFRFGSSANTKNPGGLGEKVISSQDRIFFTVTNETNSTNFTPKHLKVRLEHI